MSYYRTCAQCGANNDPGEVCACGETQQVVPIEVSRPATTRTCPDCNRKYTPPAGVGNLLEEYLKEHTPTPTSIELLEEVQCLVNWAYNEGLQDKGVTA